MSRQLGNDPNWIEIYLGTNPDDSINLITEHGRPCRKAVLLFDIISEQEQLNLSQDRYNAAIQQVHQQEECQDAGSLDLRKQLSELAKGINSRKDSLVARRTAFAQRYAPRIGASEAMDHCQQMESMWKKPLKSNLWWDSNGFLVSLNDLPKELLEEILSYVGAIEQARIRSVCKFWNALIMSWNLRRNLLVFLDDIPKKFIPDGNECLFDFRRMTKLFERFITPVTNSIVICNCETIPFTVSFYGISTSTKYATSFIDAIRPMFMRNFATVREITFHKFICWTPNLTRMHKSWSNYGLAPIERCIFIRSRIEFFSDRQIFYQVPFSVGTLENLPDPLMLEGRDSDELKKELLPYFPTVFCSKEYLKKFADFARISDQEMKLKMIECLLHWGESCEFSEDQLETLECITLKKATLFELWEIMRRAGK